MLTLWALDPYSNQFFLVLLVFYSSMTWSRSSLESESSTFLASFATHCYFICLSLVKSTCSYLSMVILLFKALMRIFLALSTIMVYSWLTLEARTYFIFLSFSLVIFLIPSSIDSSAYWVIFLNLIFSKSFSH